jgi:hypothetical protein
VSGAAPEGPAFFPHPASCKGGAIPKKKTPENETLTHPNLKTESPMPTIHLDPDLAEKLRLRAVAQGRSLTNLSNLLLRRLLGMKATPNNGRTVISKK